MQSRHRLVRAFFTLGVAALFAACSPYGSSGKITPVDMTSGSQARLAQSAVGFNAAAVEFAYVANFGSNNISTYAINASDGALKQVKGSPFAAGTGPTGLVIDPKGKFAYIPNHGSENVSAYTIDATSGALKPVTGSPFAAGYEPYFGAMDPSGKFLYVADNGSNNVSGYTVDAKSGALSAMTGSPFATGTYPDGVAVERLCRFPGERCEAA
jgi:6-phosphogluconolactonase